MKFDCGLTRREKIKIKENWHLHFVLFPIRLGSRDCRWLEWVERRGVHCEYIEGSYWIWEYKGIRKEDK